MAPAGTEKFQREQRVGESCDMRNDSLIIVVLCQHLPDGFILMIPSNQAIPIQTYGAGKNFKQNTVISKRLVIPPTRDRVFGTKLMHLE